MRLSLFLIATLGLSACATQQDATPPANATPKADMGIENVPAAPATYVPAQAASACNADAELREQFLGLVFVDVHRSGAPSESVGRGGAGA